MLAIKQEYDNKRELKKIAKENDPEYIEKKAKLEKSSDKMDKSFRKIEKRQKKTNNVKKIKTTY